MEIFLKSAWLVITLYNIIMCIDLILKRKELKKDLGYASYLIEKNTPSYICKTRKGEYRLKNDTYHNIFIDYIIEIIDEELEKIGTDEEGSIFDIRDKIKALKKRTKVNSK